MTTPTTRYAIGKPAGTDPVRDGDDVMRAAFDRIDYLLGESGEWASPATAGTTSQVVNLTRAYPNGFDVSVSLRNSTTAGGVEIWARQSTTAGGPGGVAQVELGVNMGTAAVRTLVYKIHPKP